MRVSEKTVNEFLKLTGRFMRLRPRLVFPDERMATLKRQLRELRASGSSHEDRVYLLRVPLLLSQRETPPTMSELSAELGIPMSSATRVAGWLVHAGIVERSSDPHDRRIVRLRMTENGRQMLDAGRDYLRARILQVLSHFTSAEQAQLLHLVSKLVDSIEAEE